MYPDDFDNEYVEQHDRDNEIVCCKRCGASGFHWEEIPGETERWQLVDDDDIVHDCPLVKCKYCGEGDMKWVPTRRSWKLCNIDGDVHECLKKRDKAQLNSDEMKLLRNVRSYLNELDDTSEQLANVSNGEQFDALVVDMMQTIKKLGALRKDINECVDQFNVQMRR